MLTQSKMQSEHGPFSRYHTAKGDPEYAGISWSLPPSESYFPPASESSNNSCHQGCTSDFRLTLLPNVSSLMANRLSVSHFVNNEYEILCCLIDCAMISSFVPSIPSANEADVLLVMLQVVPPTMIGDRMTNGSSIATACSKASHFSISLEFLQLKAGRWSSWTSLELFVKVHAIVNTVRITFSALLKAKGLLLTDFQNVDFSSAMFKEGHLPLLHTNCTVCRLQVRLSKLTVFSCLVPNADGCTATVLILVKLKSACVTSLFSMPAVEPNNHAISHACFFASVDGHCSASRISPGSVKSFDSCLFSSRATPSSALSLTSDLIPVTLILSVISQAETARIIFQIRDAACVNLFTVQGSELSSPFMHCLLPHQDVDELHPHKRTSVQDHIKQAFPRLSIANNCKVGCCWTAAVCVAIFYMAFVRMTWNLRGLFCHSGITKLNKKRFREKRVNAFALSVLCLATAPLCAMGGVCNLGV
jgi:hypothetical protein